MSKLELIESKIEKLTPSLLDDLEKYVDLLLSQPQNKASKNLKFDWRGGIKNEKYSAVELQKKALEWRK